MAIVLRRGSRLGKYRLDRRLGRGAFAEVWKARDSVERRELALKITHREAVAEHGRDAIELEARIASRLQHPNVAVVRNADWIDGRFVIATDLAIANLAGSPGIRRSGRLALRVVRDVAAGLGYAHGQNILHRDVKPENILIYADGHAALADFGASKFAKGANQTYTEAGTLGYMAPEQAYGRPRFTSDVFALGLIAYEILTGVLMSWPFEWPAAGHDKFTAKVPEPLRPVLRKAAAFDPGKRYEDGQAFHEALEKTFSRVEGQKPMPVRKRRKRRAAPSPLEVQSVAFRRAHGRQIGMRYECHRCGGPIAEVMSYCPWCGSGDNSYRDVTRYPLVCPECERGVRPEWNACPWCYSGRFVSNGRTPPDDPQAERTCSNRGCRGQLRPFMRYCPLCKQKTRRVWSHPDLPDRCPKCRWPTNQAFLRFCPWCGRHESRAGSFVRAGR
ncbi:MAG: protein kinase [Myxococcales bacterium]|nr:protein kinase [Myxococcales bacterium]